MAADLRALNGQLDAVVTAAKRGDKDATEYRKARAIHLADVDGDGIPDAMAFFTIEGMGGGNNYEQYIVVLKGARSAFSLVGSLQIGGGDLGGASFSRPALKNGRIVIARKEYSDSDARCCPSRKAHVTVVLQDGKLLVAPRATAARPE